MKQNKLLPLGLDLTIASEMKFHPWRLSCTGNEV